MCFIEKWDTDFENILTLKFKNIVSLVIIFWILIEIYRL